MSIGLLDIAILVIIGASAIWGIFKGFVSQIASIAALLLGLWCAFRFTATLSAQVKELLSLDIDTDIMHIIMFAAIFLAVMILSHLAGKLLEGLLKLGMLGWVNNLLGFVFGAIKSTMLLSIVAYIVNYLNNLLHIIPQEIFAESKACTLLELFRQNVFPFLEKIFS